MYDKDYLEYDEIGLKQVNCMRCNKPIKVREVVEHNLPDGKTIGVYAMKPLNIFTSVPYELSNNSYTDILMDIDCAKIHVGSEAELDGMTKQFKRGHELEAIKLKRPKVEIDRIKKMFKKIKITGAHDFDKDHRKKSREKSRGGKH